MVLCLVGLILRKGPRLMWLKPNRDYFIRPNYIPLAALAIHLRLEELEQDVRVRGPVQLNDIVIVTAIVACLTDLSFRRLMSARTSLTPKPGSLKPCKS